MGYKPIGGVRRAVLYPASAVGSKSSAVEVELTDDGSSYLELLIVEQGSAVVRHTLTLKALYSDAAPWLTEEFVDGATYSDVAAEAVMNDSREVALEGLRLSSLEIDSTHAIAQRPTVTIVLTAEDMLLR